MTSNAVRADILWVNSQNLTLPIYRVAQSGSATVLWWSRDQALKHLDRLQFPTLPVKSQRR
jgi:hypothetical protein